MKKTTLILSILAIVTLCTSLQAKVILADNGKTDYHIVGPAKPTDAEKAALKDLRIILRLISNADFTSAKGKTRQIIVGTPAPKDTKPLADYERRIVSENGNVYIYGQGKYGNVNAIYDFLKDFMGVRWFTVSGDRRLPRQKRIELDELNYSRIPSIPQVTVNRWEKHPAALNYARRNHFISSREDIIGPFSHPARRIIPSGMIPYGGREGNLHGPWRCFKDRKYFTTNPEFFSLDKNGKRTRSLQLCYSNPELRNEIVKNILIMLKDQKYKGGVAHVGIGHDDNGGKFCYCKNCVALEKKYDHPAGPYFDYIIDIANRFLKTHPELIFHFSAYREEQTLRPPRPDKIKSFPRNVLPGFAPLGADFSKPLTHPNNRKEAALFRGWGKIASVMRWSVYPSTYPRPTINVPLVANIHRLLENTEFAYENKTRRVYAEFGLYPYEAIGFGDLRSYVLFEKFRDINADEATMVKEFSETCYGKAAPGFRKYLAELEAMEAGFKKFMRWNPDLHLLNYCTAENLLRWNNDFDKMEKAVGKNKRHLLNLRRVRYALDQTIVLWWPEMTIAERQKFGDVETYISRCRQTMRDHVTKLFFTVKGEKNRKKMIEKRIKYYESGFEQMVAAARGGKELPPFFKGKKVFRVLPNRNKLPVDVDKEAAFGVSVSGPYPANGQLVLYRSYDHFRPRLAWQRHDIPKLLSVERIEKAGADGKFRWYHLGAIKLYPDCQIMYHWVVRSSGFPLTHCYDEKNPDRLFDIYVSVAADGKKKTIRFEQLVAVPLDIKAGEQKAGTKAASSVEEIDMFQ